MKMADRTRQDGDSDGDANADAGVVVEGEGEVDAEMGSIVEMQPAIIWLCCGGRMIPVHHGLVPSLAVSLSSLPPSPFLSLAPSLSFPLPLSLSISHSADRMYIHVFHCLALRENTVGTAVGDGTIVQGPRPTDTVRGLAARAPRLKKPM